MTDVTQYPVPTIDLPAGFPVRVLTADECRAKADECRANLACMFDGPERQHVERELRGWERLARERP